MRARLLTAIGTAAAIAATSAGCAHTSTGTASSSTSTATTAAHEKAVSFSECMRAHGVTGFPDPDASGTLTIDAVVNGSGIDPSSVTWKRAIGACQSLQPPGFAGTGRTATQQQAALRFAQCIRDNGVKDFPDPTADSPLVDTNRIPSLAQSSDLSVLNAAMRRCGSYAAAAGVARR